MNWAKQSVAAEPFSAQILVMVSLKPDAPVVIASQPDAQTVNPGSPAMFSITATGTDPITYQWQKDGMDIDGATSSTYRINPAAMEDAGWYACVATNVLGPVASQAARLTVNPTLNVVSAHGSPAPAQGANIYTTGTLVSAKLTGSPELDTTGTTRYRATGWTGLGSVPASGTTTQTSFVLGQNSTLHWKWATQYRLSGAVSPPGAGAIIFAANGAPAPGAWLDAGTTSTLRVTTNPGYVFAGWGGDATGTKTTASLAMSRPRTVTASFLQAPYVITQPTSQTVDLGAVVSFGVGAGGSPTLEYQWFRNGTPLADNGATSGAQSAHLVLKSVAETAEGSYACRILNGAGMAVTKIVNLQVLRPAQVTAVPTTLTYLEGSTLAVDVEKIAAPKARTLVLTNTGEKPLMFVGGSAGTMGLAISGRCAADYTITGVLPTTSKPLAPGASVTVSVVFDPLVTRRTLGLDALLTVTTDSPVTPSLKIPLLGDAVPVGMSLFKVE